MTPSIETAVILFADRYTPPRDVAAQARLLESSGVVDTVETADQMVNFVPPALWTPQHAPLARVLPDIDSTSDAFVMGAWCLAAAPSLKLAVSTDAIRRGPAEFVQTMMTLSNLAGGNATFLIGGGEVKQARPYGWRRADGLTRMEDLFRAFHAFFAHDAPFDLQGHHVQFTKAWLGGARHHRPQVWGLGGGPRLIDLVTTHGDGLCATAPCVWMTPQQAREDIAAIRQRVAEKGRDPAAFRFGMFCPVLVHDDARVIDRALDNPIARWMAATYGRVDPGDWRREGIEPAVPEGWTYYLKMLPHDTSPAFLAEVLGKTTRRMAERTFYVGTPAQVAEQMRPFAEAGVSWMLPLDYLPLMLEPEDAAAALPRSIAVCAHLKGRAHVH
ncbi:MAG TPA: LLM class flavin-dependent oxidoreductase [Nevskiaceae bacterium]|nr:LLM class flavin-dependent oxidoreductase [Nevskiaceae bacterium]